MGAHHPRGVGPGVLKPGQQACGVCGLGEPGCGAHVQAAGRSEGFDGLTAPKRRAAPHACDFITGQRRDEGLSLSETEGAQRAHLIGLMPGGPRTGMAMTHHDHARNVDR